MNDIIIHPPIQGRKLGITWRVTSESFNESFPSKSLSVCILFSISLLAVVTDQELNLDYRSSLSLNGLHLHLYNSLSVWQLDLSLPCVKFLSGSHCHQDKAQLLEMVCKTLYNLASASSPESCFSMDPQTPIICPFLVHHQSATAVPYPTQASTTVPLLPQPAIWSPCCSRNTQWL